MICLANIAFVLKEIYLNEKVIVSINAGVFRGFVE